MRDQTGAYYPMTIPAGTVFDDLEVVVHGPRKLKFNMDVLGRVLADNGVEMTHGNLVEMRELVAEFYLISRSKGLPQDPTLELAMKQEIANVYQDMLHSVRIRDEVMSSSPKAFLAWLAREVGV